MSKLLEGNLSYKIHGIFIDVSKRYGHLYKEKFYHNITREFFERSNVKFTFEPRIEIFSLESGKIVSTYIPDFLVEDKIVIEEKALKILPKEAINQLDQYLKASKYEVGYLVNFGKPKAQIIRRIYTNDRKSFVSHLSAPKGH